MAAEQKVKTSYKLIYFNARGAAELSRLIFKAAGVDFIDERIGRGEWAKRKPEMPLNTLPVLEVDGKKICQSAAIARYLAREFGLMGSSNIDGLRIEELYEVFTEMASREMMKMFHEKDESKKKKAAITFVKETLPNYLNFFEMRLKENKGKNGFYVGEQLTLADLVLYDGIGMLRGFLGTLDVEEPLRDRPVLEAHISRIEAEPRIAEWLKVRPSTDK